MQCLMHKWHTINVLQTWENPHTNLSFPCWSNETSVRDLSMLPSLEMTPQLSFRVVRSSKLSQEVWRGMSVGLGFGLGAGLWLEVNHRYDIRKLSFLSNVCHNKISILCHRNISTYNSHIFWFKLNFEKL